VFVGAPRTTERVGPTSSGQARVHQGGQPRAGVMDACSACPCNPRMAWLRLRADAWRGCAATASLAAVHCASSLRAPAAVRAGAEPQNAGGVRATRGGGRPAGDAAAGTVRWPPTPAPPRRGRAGRCAGAWQRRAEPGAEAARGRTHAARLHDRARTGPRGDACVRALRAPA